MTTPQPAALPELPEPEAYIFQHEETGNTMFVDRQQVEWGFEKNNQRLQKVGKAYTADQMRAYAIAALQAQPAAAGVSDEQCNALTALFKDAMDWGRSYGQRINLSSITVADVSEAYSEKARAILALRPQSESAAPTVEAAREMGAKGGPVVEAERLAFEAWMAGHCWAVSPTWNGKTYDDSEEDKKRKLLDPLARTTRMLWAAWRDRAALSSLRPQAVPMTEDTARLDWIAAQFGDVLLLEMAKDLPRDDMPLREAIDHLRGITAPAGGEG